MTNTDGPRVPGSLAEVSSLAPVVMAATGVMTILQFSFLGEEAIVLALGAFAIPTLGTTLVSRYLAKQQWGHALAAFAGWFVAHALVATVAAMVMSSSRDVGGIALCALVVSGTTAALATPAFIAAGVYGRRRDLEAGDAYLGFSGAWYFVGNALAGYAIFRPDPSMNTDWFVAVPGMIVGLVAIALYVGRTVRRRSFSRRAARGELSGWRVRSMSDADDLAALPPLFGSPLDATAVLERVETGATAYRSALIGIPVARVGGAAARLVEQAA